MRSHRFWDLTPLNVCTRRAGSLLRTDGAYPELYPDDDSFLGHSAADGQPLQLEQRAEALALQPEDGGGRLP